MNPGPADWRRLHPLSPLVAVGRAGAALLVAVAVAQRGRAHGGLTRRWDLVLVGLALASSVIRWLVTRWRVEGQTLRIETGLLRRDARQLPLGRIQAIDVVRPFLARVLGLAELRIRLAGSGTTDGRLAYLPMSSALALREDLLRGHQPPNANIAPSVERDDVLVSVPSGRIAAAVLLSGTGLALVMVLFGLVLTAELVPKSAAGVGGAAGAWIITLVSLTWRRFSREYGFRVAQAPDGLHLHAGLVNTTAETIPAGRIQALRVIEPLLWRPLGWCRLEADLAGSASGSRSRREPASISRAILPVGRRGDAAQILDGILGRRRPNQSAPPARAQLKSPLRYHFLSAGYDDGIAQASSGRVRRVTALVPFEKVQSIRWVQGPVQRTLRLADLHLDSAGRSVRVVFRDRDQDEAKDMTLEVVELCRQSRRRSPKPAAHLQTKDDGPVSDG